MVSVPLRGIISFNDDFVGIDLDNVCDNVSVPLRGIISFNAGLAIPLWEPAKNRFAAQKIFSRFFSDFFSFIPLCAAPRVGRRKTEQKGLISLRLRQLLQFANPHIINLSLIPGTFAGMRRHPLSLVPAMLMNIIIFT